MAPFASIVEQLAADGIDGTTVLVGGSILVGVLLMGCLVPRRRSAERKFPPLPLALAAVQKLRSRHERRTSLRRMGVPTPLLLTDAELSTAPRAGWVLDRSTGGLALLLGEELTPDTLVNVRSADAPKESPWVTLRVRRCERVKGGYLIGGQFVQAMPWHTLLLFG